MKKQETQVFQQFYEKEELDLFKAKQTTLINDVGEELIQDVVFDILTGKNVRNSTEPITRNRISRLNLALIKLFVNGSLHTENFIQRLPEMAVSVLKNGGSKDDEMIARWILGLTGKSVQNVLSGNKDNLEEYAKFYIENLEGIVKQYKNQHGELNGTIKIGLKQPVEIDWLFILYLLNFSGTQTLTIRGSEKSLYGKFFEKLVLGSLLHILDFNYVDPHNATSPDKIFWLSSTSDKEGRESDATLIYELGKGIRFDIGFIGPGNSEISLDKVSRYRREVEIGSTNYYMGTIIIVDRIGKKSKVQNLANQIDGHIVQMSASYWPLTVARHIESILGYHSSILDIDFDNIEVYLKEKLSTVPLMDFVKSVK